MSRRLTSFHSPVFGLVRLTLLFSVLAICASAQLTGPKNVPGDYPDLATAIADLNTQGVGSGGVTFNLAAGNPQTAPAGGYVIGGTGSLVLTTASAANPIVFNGNGNQITASSAHTVGALNDGVFKLIGADWVTLDGFVMLENPLNTVTTAASNTMTEWGVGLLYVTTTDGAQNNTIRGNTVDLNRTYQNTFGIYSNSTHSATAPTTSATATGAAGGNHNLSLRSNTITDVNIGIVVIGPTAAPDQNDNLDIGGASPASGNNINNYGTTGTFSGYANVSGTVNGILVRNTRNFNVSYNTIQSSNGGTTAGTLRGIYVPAYSSAPVGTFTHDINFNSISVISGVLSGTVNGINVENTTASLTSTRNINNNDFSNSGHSAGAATGTVTFISHVGADTIGPLNHSVSNNTFTNLTISSTGSVTFISNNWTRPPNGVANINNNSIVTGFNKTGSGGSVSLYNSNSASSASVTEFNNNNNFQNITVAGLTSITGWANTDGGSLAKTVTGNTFANWTGGGSSITALNVAFSGSSNVSNNTISNISSAGPITGITSGSGNDTFSQNTIHSLTSSGTSSAVTGIANTGGTTKNYSRNKIYNLQTTGTTGTVNGILVSTVATTTNISNNLIGDLRAPNASSATDSIRGINNNAASTSTTLNVSFNTIYLSATSVGANFSSSAMFHQASATATAATLNLRSNIIVNLSTPNGTGTTVAFRRAGPNLQNYGSASNNNLFYAGTPGPSNLIHADGTNLNQTLASYKALVVPRDSASVTENPPFLSTVGSNPSFLHINPTVPTQVESGGVPVAGITIDYDGDARNAGTPDIGADEFSGILLDVAPPTISYAPFSNTSQTTNRVLVVTIADASGVAGGTVSPRIYYQKNGGGYVSTQCVMTAGTPTNGTYDCTIDNSLIGGVVGNDVIQYFVVAQDINGNLGSNPGGASGTDVNTITTFPSSPNQYTIVPTVAGTYTVGAAGNFASLTNDGGLFQAINGGVLVGNVTIEIISDLTAETGTHALNNQVEEGAGAGTYTILVRPSGGAARLVSGSSLTAGGLIRLFGADRVTFDGLNTGGDALTVRNTGVNGPTFHINADASNNTLRNMTIEGAVTSATLGVVTIGGGVVGTNTTGNDNNLITNNVIRDRSDAVGVPNTLFYSAGQSSTVLNSGNIVSNNILKNFTNIAINTTAPATENWTIGGNEIFQEAGRTTALTGIRFEGLGTNTVTQNTIRDLNTNLAVIGMVFFDARSTTASRNRIYNIPSTAGSTSGLTGVQFFGSSGNPSTVTLVNNMISIVPAFTNAQLIRGIDDFGFTGNNFNVYFNTVLIGGTASGAANTFAFNRRDPSATTLRDNIFFNDRVPGTGSSFAASDEENTGTFTSNYNIMVGTGSAGNAALFMARGTGTTTPMTFAAWQGTAGSPDANSLASTAGTGDYTVANMFVSSGDLHLNVTGTNPAMNAGNSTGTGVTNDFDNHMRPQGAAPEIGADEILAPTAALVSVSGRVIDSSGNGIRNAILILEGGGMMEPRYIRTGSFGYYGFDGLSNGTYTVTVVTKRYTFAVPVRTFTLVDDITGVDFIGDPQ
jgi:hypothetical protein